MMKPNIYKVQEREWNPDFVENDDEHGSDFSRLLPLEDNNLGLWPDSMFDLFLMDGELYKAYLGGFKKLTKEESHEVFANLF